MVAIISCILNGCNNIYSSIIKILEPRAYLNWHCEQVGTQEEEPHQLVSVYGDEVANLANRHSPHGHVGGAETHYFIENLCLEVNMNIILFYMTWTVKSSEFIACCLPIDRWTVVLT